MHRAYYHAGMKATSLKLPADLHAWVASEARRAQASQSEIIRRSLAQTRDRRAAKRFTSCADVAADLVGALRGPHDLSTNKAYLKDVILRGAGRARRRAR